MTMRNDGKKALTAAGWKSSPEQGPHNSPPINGGLLCIWVSEGAPSWKEKSLAPSVCQANETSF